MNVNNDPISLFVVGFHLTVPTVGLIMLISASLERLLQQAIDPFGFRTITSAAVIFVVYNLGMIHSFIIYSFIYLLYL
jgi:hypothetical protein